MRASREDKKERAIGPLKRKKEQAAFDRLDPLFCQRLLGKETSMVLSPSQERERFKRGGKTRENGRFKKLQFVSVAATANIVFELSCCALHRPPCFRRAERSKRVPHQGRSGGHEGSQEERDEKGGPHFFALSPLFFLGGGELKEGSDQEREGERKRARVRNSFVDVDFSLLLLTLPLPLLHLLLSSSSPQLPLPFFILSIDQNSPVVARIKAAAFALLAAVVLLGSSAQVRLFVLYVSGRFES